MKKLLAILLAMLMLVSLSAVAFAEEDYMDEDNFDPDGFADMAYPECGITLHFPNEMFMVEGLTGGLNPLYAQEVGYNSGVYITAIMYDRGGAFDPNGYAQYLTFLTLRDGYDESVLNDPDLAILFPSDHMDGLCTVGEYTFYVVVGTDHIPDSFTDEEVAIYNHLLEYAEDVVNSADYYEPEDPGAKHAGTVVNFDAKDLDGNPVDLASVFASNRITMLNVWETGCSPCRNELPELAQINSRLQEIGCGIVGLLWDSDVPGAIDEAKQIYADAGVDYLTLQVPSNFDEIFQQSGFPTSYFIDQNGTVLTSVEGALVDKYELVINDLLNGGNGGAENSGDYSQVQSMVQGAAGQMKTSIKAAAAPTPGDAYRIICVDEDGNPVQGATIQFCSDIQCMMGKTDADGVAEFEEAPGHYTVHLLKVPEGYAKDGTEYEAPAVPGDLTIVVKAA